jgi:hypothetical protein
MDAERFDALSRGVWKGRDRRWLLRGVATLPIAGLLAARLVADDAAADSGRKRKRRKRQKRKRHQGLRSTRCKGLNELCGVSVGGFCCPGMRCLPTAVPVITTCQRSCFLEAPDYCQETFGTVDVTCNFDPINCSVYFTGGSCCSSKTCTANNECASGLCCKSAIVGSHHWCYPPGYICGDGGGGCESFVPDGA